MQIQLYNVYFVNHRKSSIHFWGKQMNKSNSKFVKSIITLSLGLALSACGGSDSKKDPEPVVNSVPVISSTGMNTVVAGSLYSYTLVSSDADGDALTSTASSLPAWLSFDSATGVLSGTPAQSDSGDHAITLTVSDGTAEVTQSFTITVTIPVAENNAPVITSTAIISATVGEAYTYTLIATDTDNDMLTMSTTIPGALSWLTFDETTGVLSGTPASGDVAATDITLTVTDGTDETMQTFTITVGEAAVEGPALVVYEEMDNPLWPVWESTDSAPPVIITDGDHGMVAQFVINNGTAGAVMGFNARDAVDGVAFDTPAGTTLEFDLKVTSMPDTVGTDWKLKLEDSAEGSSEVNLQDSIEGHVPVLDTWMHYSFNVSLSDVDLIMIFPAWGTGNGAEFSVDNVVFNIDPDAVATSPGDSGDGATTTTAMGIDFEGPQLTWGSFDTNPVQYVDNPATTGINTSATVALLTVLQGDGEWAGARTEGIDTFALDATNCTVKMDVYRDTIGLTHVKFEKNNGDGWGSAGTVAVSNTVINQWETLTFDTCGWIGHAETGVIDGFAIHIDQTATRSQDTLNHFDNIMFSAQEGSGTAPDTAPAIAAPAPTAATADVIAVFSDSYTAVTGVNTNPNWGQATVTTEVDIEGNNTLKMAGLNYQGIEYSVQDVSGKTTLHLDYWTADATTFDVFLISEGPAETSHTITTTQSGWQSVEIPLSTYSGVVDLTKAFQFKFVGAGTIYLDNLYFY
jgi:hypothetical protein